MATYTVTIDTDEKSVSVTRDGQPIPNLRSFDTVLFHDDIDNTFRYFTAYTTEMDGVRHTEHIEFVPLETNVAEEKVFNDKQAKELHNNILDTIKMHREAATFKKVLARGND